MNVSVTPELEAFVKGLVESGQYQSASEVFRAGLRLVQREEQMQQLERYVMDGVEPDSAVVPAQVLEAVRADLRSKVQAGIDSLERGEFVDPDQAFARWRRRIEADESEPILASEAG